MIFVSVGTFIQGYDELVSAMDDACAKIGLHAFAQIGNSVVIPRHMEYARFLTASEMEVRMQQAQLVVCHGGFGIIGDAMRAQKPIIVVPRLTIKTSSSSPSNNQLLMSLRLKQLYGINVCEKISQLQETLLATIGSSPQLHEYDLTCNIPRIISDYLKHQK